MFLEVCAITHKNSAIMHTQHTDIMCIFVAKDMIKYEK